jgi:hypothetical protein
MPPSRRKITGATYDLGYGNGEPLMDVDTVLLDLHEELGAAGRVRAATALGFALRQLEERQPDMLLGYSVVVKDGMPENWVVIAVNETTRVLTIDAPS